MGMRSVREVCIRAETVLKILFCGFWNATKRSCMCVRPCARDFALLNLREYVVDSSTKSFCWVLLERISPHGRYRTHSTHCLIP